MPIYEYICNSCREKFSRLQSVRESREGIDCPKCSSGDTKKLISSFCCSGGDSGLSSSGHSHSHGGGGG
ncbi:MAG: zinc ribbon domain-containing protein [Nitrospirae bacterium]|nr:zinc ribbon domain-containing protein [Nitrospirota bacterium]